VTVLKCTAHQQMTLFSRFHPINLIIDNTALGHCKEQLQVTCDNLPLSRDGTQSTKCWRLLLEISLGMTGKARNSIPALIFALIACGRICVAFPTADSPTLDSAESSAIYKTDTGKSTPPFGGVGNSEAFGNGCR